MTGQMQYEQALKFFEENRYEEAIESFVNLYEHGIYRQEIIDIVYSCFIVPNDEEFRKSYEENNQGFTRLLYEELPIDFIFVAEDVFYLFDREKQEFLGKFELPGALKENMEVEFDSLLLADVWDMRQLLPAMQEKNWSTIYIIAGDNERYLMSFLKIPGVYENYLRKTLIFSSEEIMKAYFEAYDEIYLPKIIGAIDSDKYEQMINKLHSQRLEKEGADRNNIFLSICIPSYERGDEALNNVRRLLQMKYDSEIEIIVSNNGSKKNCAGYEEIKKIRDSRLVYSEFEENQGYATNIRKLLGMARGRFAVFTSDEDMMMVQNLDKFLTFLLNNTYAGVIDTIVSKDGTDYVGEAVKSEKGYAAMRAANDLNYLTGITYNMEYVKNNEVLKRFDAARGNDFLEYYAHIILAFFSCENAELAESNITLWKKGEEAEGELSKELLSYMKVESRIRQMNALVELFSKDIRCEKNVLIDMCIYNMQKVYDMLEKAHSSRREAFEREYNWAEVCEKVHANNKSMIENKRLWFGDDIGKAEYCMNKIYGAYVNKIRYMTVKEIQSAEKQVNYFLNNKEKLQKLSLAERRDLLKMASYTAVYCRDIGLKIDAWNLLYYCCFYLNLDLKELWNIYWNLNRAVFEDYHLKIKGNLDELYSMIFDKVLAGITDSYEYLNTPDNNLVVMITSQFLGVQHAPTRRILDYAYTISEKLHKKVIIINDAGLNFYPCTCLEQIFVPSFMTDYKNIHVISYKNLKIPFMQISAYMPDIYCINEMLQKIYSWKPGLVYNIGGSSMLADLCTLFTNTACFPCSTNIPVTRSQYLLVGRKLNESDAERIQRLAPYQQIIETVVNYELAESTRKYERVEFGLDDDDFVIGIVGSRLDKEIDSDFIEVMNQILECKDVQFLLVGDIQNTARIRDGVLFNERIHFAGNLPEASQAMKLFDIYCNPERNGGGRSSFEALANGIPVVTLNHGDVYHTCGDEFAVNSYEDYITRVRRFVSDEEYMSVSKKKALERADYLSDLTKTQGEILNKILEK